MTEKSADVCKLNEIAEDMERVLALTEDLVSTDELAAARRLARKASSYLSQIAYRLGAAEVRTEWGVQRNDAAVTVYGDDENAEADARDFATTPPCEGLQLVSREVRTTKWTAVDDEPVAVLVPVAIAEEALR